MEFHRQYVLQTIVGMWLLRIHRETTPYDYSYGLKMETNTMRKKEPMWS